MMNNLLIYNKLLKRLDNQPEFIEQLYNYINQMTANTKLRINDFKEHFGFLKIEVAEEVLNILCELKILRKTERMYRCPKCNALLGVLFVWNEGDDIYCYNCDTIHPKADVCDTETIYSLYIASTLKLFKVKWKDKRTGLTKYAKIVAYTQSDAESVIHEYEWPDLNSIEVSTGIEIENKMLLKEYN